MTLACQKSCFLPTSHDFDRLSSPRLRCCHNGVVRVRVRVGLEVRAMLVWINVDDELSGLGGLGLLLGKLA